MVPEAGDHQPSATRWRRCIATATGRQQAFGASIVVQAPRLYMLAFIERYWG